jgi:hypothetical protein
VGVKARFHFHPQRQPTQPDLPFEVVEKPVTLADGTVEVHAVKVYAPLPGDGVEGEVRPSCLSERIITDRRSGTTRTG